MSMLRDHLSEPATAALVSPVSEDQWDSLARLDAMLLKWNEAVRLIGYKDAGTRYRRYYLEALALRKSLPLESSEPLLVDVGSGGGTPALPLAIVVPELQIVAVEPNQRKAQFLKEAARQLHLDRLDVRVQRYEALPQMRPEAVSMRGLRLEGDLEKRAWLDLAGGGRLLWVTSRSVARGPALSKERWALDAPLALTQHEDSAWLVQAERQVQASPDNS